MAEAKWIKVVTDLFDDDEIKLIEAEKKGDSILIVWMKLLCLAGKQNNSGVFQIGGKPMTAAQFAKLFRRPEALINTAFELFEAYGMIAYVNDTVTLPNWGKHQSTDSLQSKNEYMKNYMRDYREKQRKLSANGKPDETNSKSNCKTNSKANVRKVDKEKDLDIINTTMGEIDNPPYSPVGFLK